MITNATAVNVEREPANVGSVAMTHPPKGIYSQVVEPTRVSILSASDEGGLTFA